MIKVHALFSYVVTPLFVRGRWVIWYLGILFFWMLFGNAITAIRMEIPSRDQVLKIRGHFYDFYNGRETKGGYYSVAIKSADGRVFKCNCEPLDYSNCLGRRASDHQEIKHLLDQKMLRKTNMHTVMLKYLKGLRGELWLYPNNNFFGGNSCYQIADDAHIYRSYEQSTEEYGRRKHGIDVYLFWLAAFAVSMVAIMYFVVRIDMYRKGKKKP